MKLIAEKQVWYFVFQTGYKESIDFIDFDEGHPSLDVFNILACYSENAKLQFTVKFKGNFKYLKCQNRNR